MIDKRPTIYSLFYNWSLMLYQGTEVESEYGKVNKTWLLWVPLWVVWIFLIGGMIIIGLDL